MISMDNWATQAHEKLKKERSAVFGNKERAMADAVMEAIKAFCQQEPEFAQAVVQSGSFSDCMKKVAAGTGSSISDLDAYKKAVQFYFPGAQVRMTLTIDLIGQTEASGEIATPDYQPVRNDNAVQEDTPVPNEGKVLKLDLDDLLDFF